jgi:hypothetical protein
MDFKRVLYGLIAETSSGSTSQPTRRRSGSYARSPRLFPWDAAPGYMIRDRDRVYGAVVTRRLRAMGIRGKPIAPASPWQNGFAERLSDRSGASVWSTSLSRTRHICAGF